MPIRPYAAADRAACLAIFASNLPLFFDPTEQAGLERWLDAQDAGQLAYDENLAESFFVLERDGEVLGCGGFYISRNPLLLTMVWGMIARVAHHQGLGRALLMHRLALAQTQFPTHAVALDTSQHTYPFFEKLGFQVTAIITNGYGPGLDRYDMQLN